MAVITIRDRRNLRCYFCHEGVGNANRNLHVVQQSAARAAGLPAHDGGSSSQRAPVADAESERC